MIQKYSSVAETATMKATIWCLSACIGLATVLQGSAFGYSITVTDNTFQPGLPNYTHLTATHTNDGVYAVGMDTGVQSGVIGIDQSLGLYAYGIGHASSSVNLATGTLHAYARASGGQNVSAQASLSENLIFGWSDPNRTDLIRVGFTYDMHGAFYEVSGTPDCPGCGVFAAGAWHVGMSEAGGGNFGGFTGDFSEFRPSTTNPVNHDGQLLNDIFYYYVVPGQSYVFSAGLTLNLQSQLDATTGIYDPNPHTTTHWEGIFDLGHTQQLGLVLSEGVNFTSR